MQLMSVILYEACWVYVGSSSWRNPTTSGTKMGQWSVTLLPIGKPKAVDNMASVLWGRHFKSSV